MCSNVHSWAGKLPFGAAGFVSHSCVSIVFPEFCQSLARWHGSLFIWLGKCLILTLMKEAADE